MSIRIRPLAVLLALALVGAAGCSSGWTPARVTAPAPAAPATDTPVHAVQAFQWATTHRSPQSYATLFTADYVFTFSSLDPAGDAYRGALWGRDDELLAAQHLFVSGNATEEPASSITLDLAATPIDVADPRPGRDPAFHRAVTVGVTLDITRPSGLLHVKGGATFYLVRGDSAALPDAAGLPADAAHWYVQGWLDGTAQTGSFASGPASSLPARSTSWGLIKALYR